MTCVRRVLAANLLCRADALPDTRRDLRMAKTLVMAGGCVQTAKGTVVSQRTEGMAGGTEEPFDQSATCRPPVLPLNPFLSIPTLFYAHLVISFLLTLQALADEV